MRYPCFGNESRAKFCRLRRYALWPLVKLEVSNLKLWRLPHHEVEAPTQKT